MTVRPGLTTGPAGQVPVFQSPFTESNRRPSPYHGDALPTELKGHSDWASRTLPDVRRPPRRGPPRARGHWMVTGARPLTPPRVRASLRTGPCSGADEQPPVGRAGPGGPHP